MPQSWTQAAPKILKLEALYLALAFAVLYLYGGGGSFCEARISAGLIQTARLSAAATAIDAVLIFFFHRLVRPRRNVTRPRLEGRMLAAGFFAAAAHALLAMRMYEGYGHFFLEGTKADVSCFFIEGSGVLYPFIVGPALGIMTAAREANTQRIFGYQVKKATRRPPFSSSSDNGKSPVNQQT